MKQPLLPTATPCLQRSPDRLRRAFTLALATLALPMVLAQTPTLVPNHSSYYPGESISVTFAHGPGNPLDWIGIYPDVGTGPGPGSTAWLYVSGSQQAGAGLTDGTVTFDTGLNLAGDWKVYLLVNDGYTAVAEASFQVVDSWAPMVRASKPAFGPSEPITITFTNGYANPKDWIGIYAAGETPGGGPNATLWAYVDGTQTGSTGLPDGSITFAAGLATAGSYVAYFFFNDGYDVLASEAFEVSAAAALPRVVAVTPANNATDITPLPRYSATLSHGSSQIVLGSIGLTFDGTSVTPQVTTEGNNVFVNYQGNTLLPAGSVHRFVLTFADSASPPNQITNTVQYAVVNYLSLQLPAPLFFENFDTTPEGQLPSGWAETNFTEVTTPDIDFTDLNSGAYLGWTTVNVDRFKGEFVTYSDPQASTDDYQRVLAENPRYVVNGTLVEPFAQGRMAFANSGYRNGRSQVQFLYSPDFNLTGKTDVYLSFHSLWEQNQDSLGAIEFSIGGGNNWLPIAYLLDTENVVLDTQNNIDAEATFNTSRDDIAMYYDPNDGLDKGGTYGAFIAAPISPDLAPYIQARVDDDPGESKRVELFRLPQADNQARVRFRFAHAGTDSWYWGFDDFGLYSIPKVDPPILTSHPQTQTTFAGDAVTLTVAAGGVGPFTYQWLLNGAPIDGATAPSLTSERAQAANAGTYTVRVTNSAGTTDSNPAILTVQPLPDVVAGIWNFGSEKLERTSGVGTLEFADGENTSLLTLFEQGPPAIGGADPAFMRVPALAENVNGYALTMPTQPVGNEDYINRYTLAWDVLLPTDVNWMPFFNTSPDNGNDADFYVSNTGALGIGALGYSSTELILPDTWCRVVFAANLGAGRVTVYLNGTPVHTRTGASLANGRFALYSDLDAGPDLRLFNEGDTGGMYTHEVVVNSFAFISRELTPAEVGAMGGPSLAGITLPTPSTPITLAAATAANGQITFTWTGGTGPFQVQKKTSVASLSWENVGSATATRTATDAVVGAAAFYRVVGQ